MLARMLLFKTYVRVVLVLGLGLFLSAQTIRKTQGPYDLDKRIAIIVTKVDGLRLELSGINSQLAAINTKIELNQWIGGVLGGLLLAYLWSATVSDRQKPKAEVLTKQDLLTLLVERTQSKPGQQEPLGQR